MRFFFDNTLDKSREVGDLRRLKNQLRVHGANTGTHGQSYVAYMELTIG